MYNKYICVGLYILGKRILHIYTYVYTKEYVQQTAFRNMSAINIV